MAKKILLIALLFLGLVFFIVAKVRKQDVVYMPEYYVPEKISGTDTTFHQVADLRLFNQFGDSVSLNGDLANRILVINFFFTHCATVCPPLMDHVAMIQKAFHKTPVKRNDTIAQFISISVDPARDSFPQLLAYAKALRADQDRWWLCTGNLDSIRSYARNELKVIGPGDADDVDAQLHTQTIVVLDRERYIRGYYNGLDTSDILKCADDISRLYIEKKKKKKP